MIMEGPSVFVDVFFVKMVIGLQLSSIGPRTFLILMIPLIKEATDSVGKF